MPSLARLAFANLTALSLLSSACTDDEPPSPTPEDPAGRPVRDIRDTGLTLEASRCIPSDAFVTYGTSGEDELRDVAVTRDGRILIAGFENGSPGSAVGSRGVVLEYRDRFVPRATLDTLGTDAFESISIDPDTDRVWLAARSNDDVPGLRSYGSFDYLLGNLDPNGFDARSRGFASGPEFPKQLAVGGGLVAIAGHLERVIAGGSTLVNPFLSAFSATNGDLWYTTRQTTDVERYTAVDVSSQLVLVGGQIADGALPGMFVAAYSHDADILWRYRVSTAGADELAAVRTLPDGDILWAGTTSAQLGDTAHGGKDIVVGRIDATTGDARWVVQLGGEGDDHVDDLELDDAGNIYIAADATTGESTDRDVVLLSLDQDGNALSEQQWGSTGDDVPTAVALDTCGTAVIVGHTTGDLAGTSSGGRDGFVITARGGLALPR